MKATTNSQNKERMKVDDQLIKRTFKACNPLKTPPYYKQTALFTLTKNFLTDKQQYLIENNNKAMPSMFRRR